MRLSWRTAALAIAILLLAAGAFLLWPTALGGRTAYVTTHGSSMEPSFHNGDLAIVRDTDSYRVGDVVAYRSKTLDTVVLHRIIGRHGARFVFKGDNNSYTDRDQPTDADLVGRLWVHVPRAGGVLDVVHDRLPIVAAGLALLAVGGTTAVRRGRRQKRSGTVSAPSSGRPGATAAAWRTVGVTMAAVFVVGAIVATYAWAQPLTKQTADPIRYTESGTFDYGGAAPAGPAYPDGHVDTGEPVYLQQVSAVDVGFAYRFDTPAPHAVTGTSELRVVVADGKGWKQPVTLTAAAPFQGDETEVRGRLDVAAIRSMIAGVQQATGERDGLYTVTVAPELRTDGRVAGRTLRTDFRPELMFQLDSTALRLDQSSTASLHPSRPAQILRTSTEPNTIEVLGAELPVDRVRSLALLATFLAAALAWLAFLLMRKYGRTEQEQIAMRYGRRLVPATNASSITHTPIVDVGSMADLARVAEHTDTLIVHRESELGHVYVCFADLATYRYVIGRTPAPAPFTPGPPVPQQASQPAPQPAAQPVPQSRHHRPRNAEPAAAYPPPTPATF